MGLKVGGRPVQTLITKGNEGVWVEMGAIYENVWVGKVEKWGCAYERRLAHI